MNAYPLLTVMHSAVHIKPRLDARYTDLVSWFHDKKGDCGGLDCHDCFFQSVITNVFCHGVLTRDAGVHELSSCRYRLYLLDILKVPK